MNFLSLFAGIGGFDLGLEWAGMKCVGQVEKDPFCLRVLEYHWPHVKRLGDVKNVKGTEFEGVDLICGGVPCQPASCAGKRRGTQDDRWLWPEAFRIVRNVQPRWCLFENVRGLVTLEQGVVFDALLDELEAIGYEVLPPFIIPACSVDAPHRRDRVWIVANARSERRQQIAGSAYEDEGKYAGRTKEGSNELTSSLQGDRERVFSHNEEQVNGKCYPKPNERQIQEFRIGDSETTVAYAERIDGHVAGYGAGQVLGFGPAAPEVFGSETVPDAGCGGGERERPNKRGKSEPARWLPEPDVGRVAHGVPGRMDRLRSLGNAVVPQVVYQIGKAIMQADELFHS